MHYLVPFIDLCFQIYITLIIIRALLPWFPHNRFHPIVIYLFLITDPVLLPIKKALPPFKIGIDASPFVAIVVLWVLQQIINEIIAFI